ncbi:uncharacterized protein GJ701_006553 isoform 2-T2 [Geothlypis trichas]
MVAFTSPDCRREGGRALSPWEGIGRFIAAHLWSMAPSGDRGFLAITDQLHQVNVDLLGWWLCERQLPSGGLNGRPEKLPDVCYSWWVLASLKMIGRIQWIDREKLRCFILARQDLLTDQEIRWIHFTPYLVLLDCLY